MRRSLAVIALCTALGACESSDTGLGVTWSEADLAAGSEVLHIGDHALLKLEAGVSDDGDLAGAGYDRVPLMINVADDYEFCFDADGELRHELYLFAPGASEALYSGHAGDDCVTLSLGEGVHQLEIHHARKGDPDALARPLFIVPNRIPAPAQSGRKLFMDSPRFDLDSRSAAVTAQVDADVDAHVGHVSVWFAHESQFGYEGGSCPNQPHNSAPGPDDPFEPPIFGIPLSQVDFSGAGFVHESNAPCFVSVGVDTSLVLTQKGFGSSAASNVRLYHPDLFHYALELIGQRESELPALMSGFLAADDQWAGDYRGSWYWQGTILSPAVIPSAPEDARLLGAGRPVMFTGANRSGTAFHFSANLNDFRLIPTLNDNVESIWMPGNTYVYAFRDVNYSGAVSYLTGNQDNFTGNAAAALTGPDSWSSIIVKTGLPAARDTGRSILISNRRCPYCDLSGVDFRGLDLHQVDLSHANLSNARLDFIDLRGANFSHADLNAANLTAANLLCANFSHANLLNATLRSAAAPEIPFDELGSTPMPGENTSDQRLPVIAYRTRFDQAVLPTSGHIEVTADSAQGDCPDPAAPARTSFRKATLSSALLEPARWRYVDLSHANIIDLDQLDLAGVDLSGAILAGLDLSGGEGVERDLRGTNFRNACLLDVSLEGAQLSCAGDGSCVDLSGANLRGANLNYANLHKADLSGAVLSALQTQVSSSACRDEDQSRVHGARADHAFFGDANLANADLSFASFVDSQFSGPALNLDGVILTGADFSDALMAGVNLSRSGGAAPMRGIKLEHTILVDATLSGADMSPDTSGGGVARNASLNDADLRGANLDNANLAGADMTGAALSTEPGNFMTMRLMSSDSADGMLEPYTRGYEASTRRGLITDEQTTCPSGDAGPCTDDAQFVLPAPPAAPACVPDGDHFCPRRPRPAAR